MKKLLFLIVVILLGVGGYYYWMKNSKIEAKDLYKIQKIEQGDITKTVSANGTLNPVSLINVGTQVSGTVYKIYADFNDNVTEGQILAEIDPSLLSAQVAQSRANVMNAESKLDLAKANFERISRLFKKEYVSKQELDQALQEVKSAEATLEVSKAQHKKDSTSLSYMTIRSPVSGVVIDRQVDMGQTVAASFQTPVLFKIAKDLKQMQIDTTFAEADIGSIKVGQIANFRVDAFPNVIFEGRVKQIRLNPTTQQNVVTYNVVISLNNQDLKLMPGMTAYVNVITEEKKGVLLVPNSALRFKPKNETQSEKTPQMGNGKKSEKSEKNAAVYIVQDEKIKKVSIASGITDGKFTELKDGELKNGDEVIVGENKIEKDKNSANNRMRMF